MNHQILALQEFAMTVLGMKPAQLLPQVCVPGNGVQIRETARELFRLAASKSGLFVRAGKVVKLESREGCSPEISLLEADSARSEFERYAIFVKKGCKNGASVTLNKQDAQAILCSDVANTELPNLKGVINTPIPILKGNRFDILSPGYNQGSALLVGGVPVEKINNTEVAKEIILLLIKDFTFKSESDKARAVASILTPALKLGGFIKDHVPVDIVEANESQTGKGFFVSLRAQVYGEEVTEITSQHGGVGSLDESFSAALLKGCPFISFDNFRGEMKSQHLESFLTARGKFSVRAAYKGAQYVDGSVFFISITSNGLLASEDLANRASFIRLIKEQNKRYEGVDGGDIRERVEHKRDAVMGAVTQITKHWFEAGMPKTDEMRHSFRDWAQSLDWIVQNIFELPPLLNGMEEAQLRLTSPALTFLRQLAIAMESSGNLSIPQNASQMSAICREAGVDIPQLTQSNRDSGDDARAKQIGSLIGPLFKDDINQLAVDGYLIKRSVSTAVSNAGNGHRQKRYTFTKHCEEDGRPDASCEPVGSHGK